MITLVSARLLVCLLAVGTTVLTMGAVAAYAATFVVNSNDDAADAVVDGVCETAPGNGVCTLRAALEEANASPGPHTIQFDTPPPHAIVLAAQLPHITAVVTIDGTTQPGWAPGAPVVVLDGSLPGGLGLYTLPGASGSIFRGLVIRKFGDGIHMYSSATRIEDNHIVSNQNFGVIVRDGHVKNVITRNVISRNGIGIRLVGHQNEVTKNFIGTDASGTLATGNTYDGVSVFQGTANVIERNVISANGRAGVLIGVGSSNNVVADNVIGTDASAVSALGNDFGGVWITGTDPDTWPDPMVVPANDNRVVDNVISGNAAFGVTVIGPASRNVVMRNRIGTDGTGTLPLPNLGNGVQIQNSASKNQIGCLACSGLDVIAFNLGDGVQVESGVSNRITVKSIFDNAELGIDLGGGGVTPADKCDGDKGANNLQNHPALVAASASQSTGTLTVNMKLLLAKKATPLFIRLYASPNADPSGYGEGKTFLGEATIPSMLPTSCLAPPIAAAVQIPLGAPLSVGDVITVTATDDQDNTSEFSNAVPVTIAR